MRAAVVGAAGFIGSHLCRHLAGSGWEVVAIDPNPLTAALPAVRHVAARLPEAAALDELLAGNLDAIFLLAGTALVRPSFDDPIGDLRRNVVDLLTFLEAARARRLQAMVVHASSAAVYGQPRRLPIRVDDPTVPISPYGVSKLAAEHYVRIYAEAHGLRTAVVRPFSVYGPGLRKQVVWDMLGKLLGPTPPTLHGTGAETRDFVHVEDLCSALETLASSGATGGVYNVCRGEEVTIASLGAMVSRLARGPAFGFNGQGRAGDPERWRGDAESTRALGWEPKIQLEDGLRETVEWYQDQKSDAVA